jgi:hypothetical protein
MGRGLCLLLAERAHVFSDGGFALRVTGTVVELESMLEAKPGHFRFAEIVPGHSHFVEHTSLGVTIVEEFQFGKCLLKNSNRFRGIVCKIDVGGTEIGQRERFTASILQFAEYGEGLIKALDAFLLVVEREIGQAHVVQCGAASSFIGRRIGRQGVAIVSIRQFWESPPSVNISYMREGCGFMLGVSDLMPDGAGCLELLDSSLLLVKSIAGNRDRTQNVRLGFSVAGLTCLREQGLKRRECVLKWNCIGNCSLYRRGCVSRRQLGLHGKHGD